MDLRRQTRDLNRFLWMTALLVGVIAGARGVMAAALSPLAETPSPTPLDLLLTTLAMAAVVWLLLDLVERRRFARPRVRLLPPTAGARLALGDGISGHGARERTVAVG